MLTGKPIIKLIPKIEDRAMFYEEVIFKEISVKSKTDLFNVAPEIKYQYWNDVANILIKYIPKIETEWHKKVEEEFSGFNKGG